MADFLLNSDNDLDLGTNNADGLQLCPDTITETRQRLGQSFDISVGEWFADITAYIPYIKNTSESSLADLRYILGDKGPDVANYVAKVFDNHLANLDFIQSYSSSYTFDQSTRKFTYSYTAVGNEDEEVTFDGIDINL